MESHSLNLAQGAVDVSPELMLKITRDGTILAANPACTRTLGASDDELRRKSFFDFVHPDDLVRTRATMERMTEGAPCAFDSRYRHSEGSYRSIAWTAAVQGEHLYVAGRDLSAKQSAVDVDRESEDNQRLSQRIESMGQLTAGIVHDFNNSLQSIVAALELVRRLIAAGRSSETERFIANAIGSAHQAAALNDRLLSFSLRQPTQPAPISINKVIVDMEDIVRRSLPHSIKLGLELATDLWESHCDVEQAEIAVLNLILHARDAMPNGGMITIRTYNIDGAGDAALHPGDLSPGEYVCIVITQPRADLHPGDRKDALRIPESSEAASQPRLAMVGRFARRHGGDATIHSHAGRSAVTLYLPRYRLR